MKECKAIEIYDSKKYPGASAYVGCSECKEALRQSDTHCENCGAKVVCKDGFK